MPAYSRPDALARTLESLLSQTYGSYALIIADDAPTRESREIVEAYGASHPLVHYEANATRLGMVDNWRRVFTRARQRYPGSEYFAWVSDHDLWHARWLEKMVAVLDTHPDVVLAYPENARMRPEGTRPTRKSFETVGIRDRRDRLRHSARHMLAGDMIYGLVRARALEQAGVFRRVITPDRQVLLALSLFGEVRQVPEVLWYREVLRPFDVTRQRAAFFPNGTPLYAYLPWHLQHWVTMFWDFGVCGRGAPVFGRWDGARYSAVQLWWSVARELERPKTGLRTLIARTKVGRWVLPGSPSVPDGDSDTPVSAEP